MLNMLGDRVVYAPDDLSGAGDGGGTDAVERPASGVADAGGDKAASAAAQKGGDAPSSTAGAAPGGETDAKAAETVLADLALTDDLRGKVLAALPKETSEKAGKWLKTRASIVDLVKAGLGADSKISELTGQLKGAVRLPGKDAKPEEIAAYRKAVGVPETADKYAVYRPNGFEPTDADVETEKVFLEAAHAMGLPQAQVDGVLKTHYQLQEAQKRQFDQRAQKAAEAAEEDLRAEWGRDYKANVALSNRWLDEHLAPHMGKEWTGLMDKRFADGTALGEHPGFVKAIHSLARAWADDGLPDLGDSGGGEDIDTRVNTMRQKLGTPEYEAPAFQDELKKLIGLQLKRNAGRKAA
jgi:hypothetical protein